MVEVNKDLNEAFIYDDEGFLIGKMMIDANVKYDFKYTLDSPDKSLVKPRFDGENWAEGMDKEEVMLSMLMPRSELELDSTDFLILKILGILKKGGVIVDNKWFFQYCMFCWAERRIEENYLEMAKKLKMLTDEQITMIKMTPRVSEN